MQFELIHSSTNRRTNELNASYDLEIRIAFGKVQYAQRELGVPADMIAAVKGQMVKHIVAQAIAKDLAQKLEAIV